MPRDENTLTLVDDLYRSGADWIVLIKEIRKQAAIGLEDAQDIALSHAGWRRRCNHSMNHNAQCRKIALRHVKTHGVNSRIVVDGAGLYRIAEKPSVAAD